MAEKILELLEKRRKEALEAGRLIHPEPLIAEIRRRRKMILIKKGRLAVLRDRILEFLETVERNLRDLKFWASYASGIAADRLVGRLIR